MTYTYKLLPTNTFTEVDFYLASCDFVEKQVKDIHLDLVDATHFVTHDGVVLFYDGFMQIRDINNKLYFTITTEVVFDASDELEF